MRHIELKTSGQTQNLWRTWSDSYIKYLATEVFAVEKYFLYQNPDYYVLNNSDKTCKDLGSNNLVSWGDDDWSELGIRIPLYILPNGVNTAEKHFLWLIDPTSTGNPSGSFTPDENCAVYTLATGTFWTPSTSASTVVWSDAEGRNSVLYCPNKLEYHQGIKNVDNDALLWWHDSFNLLSDRDILYAGWGDKAVNSREGKADFTPKISISYLKEKDAYTATLTKSDVEAVKQWGNGFSLNDWILPPGYSYRITVAVYSDTTNTVGIDINNCFTPQSEDTEPYGNDNDDQNARFQAPNWTNIVANKWHRVTWGTSNSSVKPLYIHDKISFKSAGNVQVKFVASTISKIGSNASRPWNCHYCGIALNQTTINALTAWKPLRLTLGAEGVLFSTQWQNEEAMKQQITFLTGNNYRDSIHLKDNKTPTYTLTYDQWTTLDSSRQLRIEEVGSRNQTDGSNSYLLSYSFRPTGRYITPFSSSTIVFNNRESSGEYDDPHSAYRLDPNNYINIAQGSYSLYLLKSMNGTLGASFVPQASAEYGMIQYINGDLVNTRYIYVGDKSGNIVGKGVDIDLNAKSTEIMALSTANAQTTTLTPYITNYTNNLWDGSTLLWSEVKWEESNLQEDFFGEIEYISWYQKVENKTIATYTINNKTSENGFFTSDAADKLKREKISMKLNFF